ncbi:MAG: LacI family DNA-binding transcriptional regulator [Acidimicrobiales bacterium]
MRDSRQVAHHRSTIGQVATAAGVSKTTVSHVLNKTRPVSEGATQRVLDAVEQLNYWPSAAARSLRTKKSGVVGVIISDARNQFFGELLRGIEWGFGRAGYAMLVCNTDEQLQRERLYLELLMRQHVDGIIVGAASRDWPVLNTARSYHLPMVFVDRRFDQIAGPVVGVDNEGGAYLGTRHLIDDGYREIGLIAGFSRLSTIRERTAGFTRALRESGLQAPKSWVAASPLSVEGGRSAARRVLSMKRHPRALFINNNLLTLGTLLALKDLGLRCPRDVAIVAFDDHAWAPVSDPPITVVDQPVHRLGQMAAKALSDLMEGRDVDDNNLTLPCSLILRESCASHDAASHDAGAGIS